MAEKMAFLLTFYRAERKRWLESQQMRDARNVNESEAVSDFLGTIVKWSRNLKRRFLNNRGEDFRPERIRKGLYRPFCTLYFYNSPLFIDESGSLDEMFSANNVVIGASSGSRADFAIIGSRYPIDLNLYSSVPTQCLPLYRYDKSGNRLENVTNWALTQFRTHYADDTISRSDIFNYVYGVLHDPAYRKKYELNLRREFPRVPFTTISCSGRRGAKPC